VFLVSLAGCGQKSPALCDEAKRRFFECTEGAHRAAFDAIYDICARGLGSPEVKAMFEDCAHTQSCSEHSGCYERHGCKLVLTGPKSKTLQLMCELPGEPATR